MKKETVVKSAGGRTEMTDYKIVVPLDGSRLAEHPLAYIKSLKRLVDGDVSVQLLSCIAVSDQAAGLDEVEARDRAANLLSTYLREVATDLHEHAGVEVTKRIITGVPSYALTNEILAQKPDLLVVATHGRSGVSRWRFGSVADKLIRSVECNTLVIGPKSTENETWVDTEIEAPFQSILVPLDGSGLAEHGLTVARDFAARYGSELHLVSVVNAASAAAGFGVEGFYGPAIYEATIEETREYLAKTRCNGTAREQTVVMTGDAATVLEDYVRQHSIGLVVMTTHGRGGLIRTALGSVTDRMLSASAAPVLVVRPRESE
jgi:nucleotide-binding universal stress UspA family protein